MSFPGTIDQSYIPHAIAYSACLGEHRLRCQGLENYTMPLQPPHIVGSCISPELPGISAGSSGAGGQQPPVVIASSVMADDSQRIKSAVASSASATFAKLAFRLDVFLLKSINAPFTMFFGGVCWGWLLKRLRGT